MKTPQIEALPGMTPLGAKPNKPVQLVARDIDGNEMMRQGCADEAEAKRLMVRAKQVRAAGTWAIETEIDAERVLAEKMKPARLSPTVAPSAHTPGPWKVANDGQIQCPDLNQYGNWIVAAIQREMTPEDQANARLIAAAPDLLTWAKELLAWEDDVPPPGTRGAEIFEALADAIAKAEGSAP